MPTPEERRLARRRMFRRRRQVAAGALLFCCTLLTTAGFKLASALTNDDVASASGKSTLGPVTSKKPGGAITAPRSSSTQSSTPKSSTPKSSTPKAAASKAAGSQTSPATTAAPASSEDPEAGGAGVYTRAPGSTAPHGSGTLKTYRVEVETGTGQSAPAFAASVDATLANPSSWTGHGLWTLQRVDGDAVVDFVIRLASPATVDNVCATAGLDTKSNVSCRAGAFVMINVDRWLKAVPDYVGDVLLYRQYVVNHEVGHQLGYGHQACPGPGQVAPVMQQQTLGLNGCVKNGWPYADGKLVTGPATS